MKFWQTKEFKRIDAVWKKNLKRSKFDEIENRFGDLKQHDLRTISSETREFVSEFFSRLGFYIWNHKVPKRDLAILEMYCDGKKIIEICEKLMLSDSTVRNTIRSYRDLILGRK